MKNIILHLRSFLEKDWFYEIGNFYNNINPVYRHSFWILFIITNIVFGFHTVNFLWADHDWQILVGGAPLKHSLWEGRYGAFVISEILTGNQYLPILTALLAFAALSLSAILLAVYWKLPKKTSYFIIFGLILNITPYTCAWLYFGHWFVNIFFARVFIFLGIILSDKISHQNGIGIKIFMTLSAIVLMNFGFSVNPSFLNTFVIAISGRILIEMLDWKLLWDGIKKSFNQNVYTVFNMGCSITIFKIVFMCLQNAKKIPSGRYNLENTPIEQIPDKILQCVKAAWLQFTDFAVPFYPNILTQLFLVLAIIFMIQIIVSQKSGVVKFCICSTFIATLFLTKVVAVIGQGNYPIFLARIDFCGYVLFNSLIVLLCIKTKNLKYLHNIILIICCCIIYLFVVNDFHQQRTFKLTFDREIMTYDRMYARLEGLQNFIPNRKYIVIQLGRGVSGSANFYNLQKWHKSEGGNILPRYLNTGWRAFTIPSFYNANYVKQAFKYNSFTKPKFMSALKRIYDAGLLENAKAWPAQNSIIVYEDIILVITDEKDLQKAKQLLAEQDKKEKVQKDKINVKAKSAENLRPQMEAK